MSASPPRVSVIVPVYNAEAYLQATVESLLAQTYTDWEAVLCDDGSTDGSLALSWELAQRDVRIRVITQRNSGHPGTTRNTAVKASQGELIAFLDSDDLWESEKLAHQVAALDASPEAGVCHTAYDLTGDPETVEASNRVWQWYQGGEVTFRRQFEANCFLTSTVMMRRSLFDALGGFDEAHVLRGSEDLDLWNRMLLQTRSVFVPEVMTHYRIHGASISHKSEYIKDKAALYILGKLRDHPLCTDKQALRSFEANIYYQRAIEYLYFRSGAFRGDMWRAFRLTPTNPKLYVSAALCWLPAPVLRPTLSMLLALKNALMPGKAL